MRIERDLKLAVWIDREDGSRVVVHAKPLSREAFGDSWRMLAHAWSEITRGRITPDAALKVASRLVKDAANELYPTDGADKTASVAYAAFSNEIRRNATVIMRTDQGWQPMPFDAAVGRKELDADDAEEVESVIAFFTLVCAMAQPNRIRALTTWISYFIDAQTTSLDYTEYAASLPISTPEDNTGEKTVAS